MTDHPLLDSGRRPLPLPPDAPSPVPAEVEAGLVAFRAGDAPAARALLTTIAGTGRTSVSGHAAMALAGIELGGTGANGGTGLGGSCRQRLERVATGEDPWLGPLAAVMLAPDFESYTSLEPGRPLLRSLAAQLTGDPDTARDGFERAADVYRDTETGDVANLLLGNLLVQHGDKATALKPLRDARKMCDGVFAGHAGHLEGHILWQDDTERAGKVLNYAHGASHPARHGSKELHTWVALRYGEFLADNAFALDLVHDQIENSGVTEGDVVRQPFESALGSKEDGGPSLVDIGFNLFPADFGPVRTGLERLKTWSDERYERGRRLVLALHELVHDSRDEQCTRGLAELREKHGLPRPH
ncbi:hypothetical protein [Streptomyces sp. NBC_01508]|uniref:hypothetical protein n=1 Tax=Streptomyces sp. NBC_01508 TaxID=2903888 RepID=UPI0038670A8A